MSVPFLDLKPLSRRLSEAVLPQWAELLGEARFIDGALCRSLEQRLAARLDCPKVLACSNGTDAIVATLMATGIGPGDLVALPNLTFWASYEAPAMLGAKILLLDIGDDLHLDPEQLESALARFPLKAVILPHLYGYCATHVETIRHMCAAAGVPLVEDCAQAFGVEIGGRSLFYGAEFGTMSFYPAKVMGGCMDGGAISCRDDAAAARLSSLINHGRRGHYSYAHVGLNARMGEMQATYLLAMLDLFDEIVAARAQQHQLYIDAFATTPGIEMITAPGSVRSNHYLCPVLLSDISAANFVSAMNTRGIGAARVYPETISQQAPAAGALTPFPLKRSLAIVERLVCLPMYLGLAPDSQDKVIAAVESLLCEEKHA